MGDATFASQGHLMSSWAVMQYDDDYDYHVCARSPRTPGRALEYVLAESRVQDPREMNG